MSAPVRIEEFPATPAKEDDWSPSPEAILSAVILVVAVALVVMIRRKIARRWQSWRALPARRRILAVAAVAFVLCGLFPPWVHTFDRNGDSGGHTRKPAGHAFLLDAPETLYAQRRTGWPENYGVELDLRRLSLEWLIVAVTAIGASAITRSEP